MVVFECCNVDGNIELRVQPWPTASHLRVARGCWWRWSRSLREQELNSKAIGTEHAEKQQQGPDGSTVRVGQCVTGLQMGTSTSASQAGMMADGTRRHLYNPRSHILPLMGHSTISLQMGINRCASQVGMMAPGTRWHIYDTKLGTDRCDNSSVSLRMRCTQGANQRGLVRGLGWKVHDPKYCPQGPVADRVPGSAGHCPSPGKAPEYHPY
ncbi:calponin-2-like [Phyllostomus hastatus]|uniref:calponin-2-like n=1 Tax=Phyllostomus hastatus TaxID=9423 RepID=UPI001E67F75B|nr:calponin-2-like [Phyllostomus hastatus]